MFSTPLDFKTIVTWFGWFIFTQDRAILLRFTLHFHPERTYFQRNFIKICNKKRGKMGIPLGPRIRTVSWPAPAPRVSQMKRD